MASLQKMTPFPFYLSIAMLLVFLYLIAAYASVLLLYAGDQKISLKDLFQEIFFHRNMLSKMTEM